MPLKYKRILFILIFLSFLSIIFFKVFPSSRLKADGDETPPELVVMAFSKEEVNTEEKEEKISLFVRVKNGSEDIMSVMGDSISPSDYHAIQFRAQESLRLYEHGNEIACQEFKTLDLPEEFTNGLPDDCGNATDIIYEFKFTLPRYSPKGEWISRGIVISTNTDNYSFYNDLPTFENTAKIGDVTPPELLSISLSPISFDTTNTDAEIEVIMDIKDDFSGLLEGNKGVNLAIQPLAYSGYEPLTEQSYTVVSEAAKYNDEGKLIEGRIKLTVTIPKGSKPGLWTITQIDLIDQIGNHFAIHGYKAFQFRFPNLDLFLANQALSNEVILEDDWTIDEWDDYKPPAYLTHPLMSIKIEEGTKITKKEGGSFALHRMIARKYSPSEYKDLLALLEAANNSILDNLKNCDKTEGCIDTPLNSTNLSGEPVSIIKVGIPGLNISFSKPVIVSIAMDKSYLGQTLLVQTFNIATGEWDDETTCTVKIIEPDSYEHGGNEDFFYKPGPYPACQFTIDHATFFSMNVLGEKTEEKKEAEKAGVPNTGVGGAYNYFIKWMN